MKSQRMRYQDLIRCLGVTNLAITGFLVGSWLMISGIERSGVVIVPLLELIP